MFKSSLSSALIAGSIVGCIATPAVAGITGFTGPFAPNNFTTTITGNLTGSLGGSTMFTGNTLTITGGNAISPDPSNFATACIGAISGVAGPCQIDIATTNILDPFVFDWSYASADSAGSGDDLFGLLIDGVRMQLSDPGGNIFQSGHVSIAANGSFGWYINCTDCIEGAAVVRITGFQAGSIPEPGTVVLLGVGAIVAGGARRKALRRKRERAIRG